MIIADKLRKTNRAEYLLYLWQVEDILRVYGCDAERLKTEYLSRFKVSDEVASAMEQWYADLCDMMHAEGVMEKGHLQLSKNVLQELSDLHARLLASSRFPYYREMYYKVLPYVVELRSKGGDNSASELESCFDALYGVLLLRLQGKKVTPETERAAKDITTLLGQLSDYYFRDRECPLEPD